MTSWKTGAAAVALAQVVHAGEVQAEGGGDQPQLGALELREGVVALDRHEVAQARVPVVGDEDVLGQHEVAQDEGAVAAVPAVRAAAVVRDRGAEPRPRPVVGAALLAGRLLADRLVDHRRDAEVGRAERGARHAHPGRASRGKQSGSW